jgi:hypothetical protein
MENWRNGRRRRRRNLLPFETTFSNRRSCEKDEEKNLWKSATWHFLVWLVIFFFSSSSLCGWFFHFFIFFQFMSTGSPSAAKQIAVRFGFHEVYNNKSAQECEYGRFSTLKCLFLFGSAPSQRPGAHPSPAPSATGKICG